MIGRKLETKIRCVRLFATIFPNFLLTKEEQEDVVKTMNNDSPEMVIIEHNLKLIEYFIFEDFTKLLNKCILTKYWGLMILTRHCSKNFER